jgi:hypothetical protein
VKKATPQASWAVSSTTIACIATSLSASEQAKVQRLRLATS